MSPIAATPSSAFAAGQAGLSASSNRLDQAAAAVASPATTDYVDPLVEANQASFQAAASAQIIKTSDSLLGTLLDIFA